MTTLWAFLKALPALIAMVKVIEAHLRELKIDQEVSDSVKVIHDAFQTKDATKLDALFNPPPR